MSKTANTAEKTIVDADKIAKALQENSTKQLQVIMEEALSNLIKEEEESDESEDNVKDATSKEAEDNSYDVEDVATTDDSDNNDSAADTATDGEEEGNDAEKDTEDDEWSDLDKYKVNGDDYDFTGADGETILKVYNKLGDGDEIVVTKDEDGNYEFKDDKTGTEYVIELDPEGEEGGNADDTIVDGGNEGSFNVDIDVDGDDVEDNANDSESEIELNLNDGSEDNVPEDDTELEFNLTLDGDDDEDDELNEGDLGYTTTYQKDVFKGGLKLGSNNKPNTNDWDGGAPDGSARPYGKKGETKPFDTSVNECGTMEGAEANIDETKTIRKSYKTKRVHEVPSGHEDYIDAGSQVKAKSVNETAEKMVPASKVQRIYEAAKQIQAENKQYKTVVDKIKKSLYEAAVVNANMGSIINLLVNETTTKAEKLEILESFNNAKTVKEGKQLYESYHKRLSGKTEKTAIMERTISMDNKSMNETTIYTQKNPSIDLMERMNNLYK